MLGRIRHLYVLIVLLLPLWMNAQIDSISVFFDTDRSNLRSINRIKIDSLLALYDKGLIQSIDLIGLADHRGSVAYNLRLSERRANSVADYIMERFPAQVNKIHQKAMGEQENSTDLLSNRRVDIIVKTAFQTLRIEKEYAPGAILIANLSVGNVLRIKGLNFHPGRSILLPKSIPHLKDLEQVLLENPNLEIEIQGHVCCPDQQKNGNDGFNLDTKENNLSISRANNIYNYLIRKGIDAERLSYRGFGPTTPIVYPEESEEDRIQNRRVELLIIKL
ncbi:MAG: outer membrane protein OmpA-like peptidoglycan-associated protein [Saprospiraceae bacterium]|jgi:outer membrane protein OmpA-like peptidoglycan-associated protein